MSLSTESTYTLEATTSVELRAEQFGVFFESVLGFVKEVIGSNNSVFWCDENKTCGVEVNWGSSGTDFDLYSGNGNVYNISLSMTNYASDANIYYQISKSGDVIYFRVGTTQLKLVCAKDEAGDWYIFHSDKMVHKNGNLSVQNESKTAGSTVFTAVKMPAIVSDKMFTELYKMISSTTFIESNTYVNFGGQPYKVVSVSYSTSSSSILPCFAFPV